MSVETTAAEALHTTEGDSACDEACKRLLSEKQILARLMKECLKEYKDCDVKEIAEKLIEGTPQISTVPVMPDEVNPVITGMDTQDKTLREGVVTYDIRFYAIVPGNGKRKREQKQKIVMIINVETQGDFYPGYPLTMRGVFYCCRMISSQYGREFTHSHYEKIKKVCSIWICINPPKGRENTIIRYHMAADELVGSVSEPAGNYDLLEVIMICLGGAEKAAKGSVLRMLDVLLSEEQSEKQKRDILENEYNVIMTEELERKVAEVSSLSDYYEMRGIEKGREKSLSDTIKNLITNMGWNIEQAMNAIGIPESEKGKYRTLLAEK